MAKNIDRTDTRPRESRVVAEETERRPGERVVGEETETRPAEPREEVRTTPQRSEAPELGTTEARQGVKRPMVGRTLAISLTLAVLAMIILWFVFT